MCTSGLYSYLYIYIYIDIYIYECINKNKYFFTFILLNTVYGSTFFLSTDYNKRRATVAEKVAMVEVPTAVKLMLHRTASCFFLKG